VGVSQTEGFYYTVSWFDEKGIEEKELRGGTGRVPQSSDGIQGPLDDIGKASTKDKKEPIQKESSDRPWDELPSACPRTVIGGGR